MKELVTKEKGFQVGQFEIGERQRTEPSKGEILVKVVVSALNPVDIANAHGFLISAFPVVLGCEISGIVESVGEGVTKFKKGDEVFGLTEIGRPGYGGYAEYALMQEQTATRKPSNWSFESAAASGVGSYTTALGLFGKLKIPFPSEGKQSGPFLVWGASGNVGLFSVQLARAIGFEVIATSSPRNFDLVKSFGASHVFDHSDPETPGKIKSLTEGKIKLVMDCVSKEESIAKVLASISEEAQISCVLGVNAPHPESVKLHHVLLGGITFKPDQLLFIEKFTQELEHLIESGAIVPPPIEVIPGGLGGIFGGLQKLAQGVSGKKLVVPL